MKEEPRRGLQRYFTTHKVHISESIVANNIEILRGRRIQKRNNIHNIFHP
jgi:hypothetical protein